MVMIFPANHLTSAKNLVFPQPITWLIPANNSNNNNFITQTT